MGYLISVVVCTQNRSALLKHCLNSLVSQTVTKDLFEVLVVDNNSTDDTRVIVKSFLEVLNITYAFEEKIGLSHARNTGMIQAKADWVLYVDDDAKAYNNLLDRALFIINNFDFDCFGGRFLPWYLTPKPDWLSKDFGAFPLLKSDVGEIQENQFVPGGVLACKRSILMDIGGFPIELGMVGTKVGYGEENWVQMEMRRRGFKIGFDPELKIDHLVANYKYTLLWHLKRQYAKGKTAALIEDREFSSGLGRLLKAIFTTAKEIVLNFPKMALNRNYYYQNYVLDSVSYFVRSLGYLLK